ncbi:hypothetical protein D3C71_2106430 [compost metagenome]
MQVAALAESDELFNDRADFLSLRQGRNDLLVLDQRSCHVGKHCLAVAGGSIQLAAGFTVAHCYSPSLAGICPQSNG